MKRYSTVLGAIAAVLLASPLASAQQAPAGQAGGRAGGPAAPPLTNLQVLPKDWTFQQVLPVMQGFVAALGVQNQGGCAYCHVYTAPNSPMNDLASDVKPAKKTALVMLRMAQTVNATLASDLGKPAAEVTRVGCVTCHRGVTIPKQLVDIVVETGNQTNAAAAIAKYRDLRKQYYGAQAYDFTDNTLFTAAQRATAANKPDDAIAYAQLNLEFNPTSARSHQAIAQAYQRKMDIPNAIAALEKAVAMEPMNMPFQNQLNALKNPQAGRGQAGGGRGQ